MGAWDVGTFDNDTACDWAGDLEESRDLSVVRAAIEAATAVGDDYLDADVGCVALAACEVVARLKGNWGPRNSYTERVDAWVTAHPVKPTADVVTLALAAIDRVLTPPSELLELWDEGGRNDPWHAAVDDLRARVVA